MGGLEWTSAVLGGGGSDGAVEPERVGEITMDLDHTLNDAAAKGFDKMDVKNVASLARDRVLPCFDD